MIDMSDLLLTAACEKCYSVHNNHFRYCGALTDAAGTPAQGPLDMNLAVFLSSGGCLFVLNHK